MNKLYWFALTGPSGTGKTTLMYEVVAMLRECSIEAVGCTERVRLMPKVTHKELMEDPNLHTELITAQMKIEEELASRPEHEVIVLDRCLLDYVLLGGLSHPSYKSFYESLVLPDYYSKFTSLFMPDPLPSITHSSKERPDNKFRLLSKDAFDKVTLPTIKKITGPLADRAADVFDTIMSDIGRSDIFRNWYRVEELAKAVKMFFEIYISKGKVTGVWLTGSQAKMSPTLPGRDSDIDFFVCVDAQKDEYIFCKDNVSSLCEDTVQKLCGTGVQITVVTPGLLDIVTLKERVI